MSSVSEKSHQWLSFYFFSIKILLPLATILNSIVIIVFFVFSVRLLFIFFFLFQFSFFLLICLIRSLTHLSYCMLAPPSSLVDSFIPLSSILSLWPLFTVKFFPFLGFFFDFIEPTIDRFLRSLLPFRCCGSKHGWNMFYSLLISQKRNRKKIVLPPDRNRILKRTALSRLATVSDFNYSPILPNAIFKRYSPIFCLLFEITLWKMAMKKKGIQSMHSSKIG